MEVRGSRLAGDPSPERVEGYAHRLEELPQPLAFLRIRTHRDIDASAMIVAERAVQGRFASRADRERLSELLFELQYGHSQVRIAEHAIAVESLHHRERTLGRFVE